VIGLLAMAQTASAAGSALDVSTHHVNFGSWPVSFGPTTSSVFLTNKSSSPVFVSYGVQSGANFGIDGSSDCGGSLGAGATCVVNVYFDPNTTGHLSDRLNIFENSTNTVDVGLAGRGV
jgi:hypothetical protein